MVEQREEAALSRIQAEMARTNESIRQLSAQIEEFHRTRQATMERSLTAYQLQAMLQEVAQAAERRKALQGSLMTLEQQRQAQMIRYQTAHRDRQMLTDMAERQRDAYEIEHAKKEQKMLDDIFAARSRQA
jgi:flagellar export protein FliJ